MRISKIISVFALMTLSLSASAQKSDLPSAEELYLSAMLKGSAEREVELFIPKGKFSVDLNLKIDRNRLKSVNEESEFTLPLSQTTLTTHEMQMLQGAQLTERPLQLYLDSIQKIDVQVRVAPDMPASIRSFIDNAVSKALRLQTSRGDTFKFVEYSPEVTEYWKSLSPINEWIDWLKSSTVFPFVVGGVAVAILLLCGMFGILFTIRNLSKDLTVGLEAQAKRLVEVLEGGMGLSGVMGGQQPALNAPSASSSGQSQMPAARQGAVLDMIDENTWIWIIRDGLEAYPQGIESWMNHTIPITKVNRVEELYENTFGFPLRTVLAMKHLQVGLSIGENEWAQEVSVRMPEYMRASRSALTQQVAKLSHDTVMTMFMKLDDIEKILLISGLTPAWRLLLTSDLPQDVRMDLAAASRKQRTTVEQKQAELSLATKVEAEVKKLDLVRTSTPSSQFQFLEKGLLEATSFKEEEERMESEGWVKMYPNMSVLECVDGFQEQDWEALSLNTVAHAFYGYSEEWREKVLRNYSAKKRLWTESMMQKAEKDGLQYRSDASKQARSMVLEVLKKRREVPGEQPLKNAS